MVDASAIANGIPNIANFNIANYIPPGVANLPWMVILDIFGGVILALGLLWYFTKKGSLKYNVQIYERDSSGIPVPVDTDVLQEKSINKGKNTIYMLKKYQALAHPPTSKFIYKRNKSMFGQEQWCDYLRERQDFIPVQRLADLAITNTEDMVLFTKNVVEAFKLTPENARQKFIYSPLIPSPIAKLKFEPMDYSMTEMLQVRLAQREALYADRQGWMQTYGPTIGIGLAAVCIIVVAFLSFQYATGSITHVTDAANQVAIKLGDLATNAPRPAV